MKLIHTKTPLTFTLIILGLISGNLFYFIAIQEYILAFILSVILWVFSVAMTVMFFAKSEKQLRYTYLWPSDIENIRDRLKPIGHLIKSVIDDRYTQPDIDLDNFAEKADDSIIMINALLEAKQNETEM